LARAAIGVVASEPAGPPDGGLYLKPPSRGGLCEGVISTPSADPGARRLCLRMAWDTAGVGVKPSRESTITSTPLATSTSRAVRQAGSERPWVSRPRNSGPVIPALARCSAIAWLMARMWASLKAPSRLEPRWPEVPNVTRWSARETSGRISS
jgi:hypothetical protein